MIRLTKYGIREWLGSGIIALLSESCFIFIALKVNAPIGWTLFSVTVLVWLCIAAFFRVPSREIPAGQHLIVSPADGVVKDIELIKNIDIECFGETDVIRVGVFLSVLDVHVNRAPINFAIEYKKYRPGKFHDARSERCEKENESMMIAGTANTAGIRFPVGIKQISGALARRIVCPVEPNVSKLNKGEIYGMIKFGSRTELYLPASKEFEIKVKIGDRVFAGSTIMAEIKKGC
jgi:phosphatidylserine decarboxylase